MDKRPGLLTCPQSRASLMPAPIMDRFAKTLTVHDLSLAAALVSYNVPPDPRGFEDHFDMEGRRFFCWHFLDRTTHSNELTVDLIAAWKDPDAFNAKHPTHPWSYVMIAFKNREHLRQRCAKNAPKYILQRGGAWGVVDPASKRSTQETILAKIGI